jgi:muramoyltetrapeptide carboxypeptidase
MNRRFFNKILTLATMSNFIPEDECKSLFPPKLKIGDTVMLITCSSSIDENILERCKMHMELLGLNVKLSKNILAQNGYLGGNDNDRIQAIHEAFLDKTVQGVWCARGGYGLTRILDKIDYHIIKNNPKVFIGYSDVTALHAAIYKKTGLITFHGPVGNSEMTEYTLSSIKEMLFESHKELIIKPCLSNPDMEMFAPYIIKSGKATGKLVGGNLCLLAALCGTKYQFDFKDKIVFLEEIDERPYRIDRMLTQLSHSTNINKAAGIVLGVFRGCNPEINEKSQTLKETFELCFKDYNMPIAYGYSFGHVDNQCTLPYGVEATMGLDNSQLLVVRC